MYYVYRLTFEHGVYIGCTNNIRRRKNQHNENARKQKSKLGNYLFQNGIVLTVNDFEIVYSFSDRKEALLFERETTKNMEASGFHLLNDNYSYLCSRKGKNIGNTAKEYVVVDFVDHKTKTIKDLRQYSLSVGLDYKLLQRTVKGENVCYGRYKVFYLDHWKMVKDKERFVSGRFLTEKKERRLRENANRTAKNYLVSFPDGHIEVVTNLDKFARSHNLTSGTLHATYKAKKPTKGYQVIKRI